MNEERHIAELMASRVCHGLAATVGAIGNGIELIEEFDASMRDEAMELISMSAASASGQLKFFRMAYGLAGYEGLAGFAEVRSLAAGIFDEEKVKIDWGDAADTPGAPLAHGIGKLLLLMVEIAGDALQRQGSIIVSCPDSDRISVLVQGSRASVEENLMRVLTSDVALEDLTARTVHGHYARSVARSLGGELTCEQNDDSVRLSVVKIFGPVDGLI